MNLANIRERLENGFKPFALELSSGRRLTVPHPDYILVGRNVVAVLHDDDVVTTVDALHIVALEDLPAGKSS
jgi:hypothetical protein